ncbi:hypothetical protein EON66_05315 [archaeon]|nr:MAG: hypothetical protein EON66_05315 [archaeon]
MQTFYRVTHGVNLVPGSGEWWNMMIEWVVYIAYDSLEYVPGSLHHLPAFTVRLARTHGAARGVCLHRHVHACVLA